MNNTGQAGSDLLGCGTWDSQTLPLMSCREPVPYSRPIWGKLCAQWASARPGEGRCSCTSSNIAHDLPSRMIPPSPPSGMSAISPTLAYALVLLAALLQLSSRFSSFSILFCSYRLVYPLPSRK